MNGQTDRPLASSLQFFNKQNARLLFLFLSILSYLLLSLLFSGEKEEEEEEEERRELGLNALSSCPLFFVLLVFLSIFSLTAELRMAISIPAADGPAVDVVPDFPLFFSPFFSLCRLAPPRQNWWQTVLRV